MKWDGDFCECGLWDFFYFFLCVCVFSFSFVNVNLSDTLKWLIKEPQCL